VSAGVIGLDRQGAIELPNRAASQLLGVDLRQASGQKLAEIVPEFAPLMDASLEHPEVAHTAELQIGPRSNRRTLLVRIDADRLNWDRDAQEATPEALSFVATFDDITQLQSAQRKAAWADVARRIAHEIKNPLTPIQLSAERLKRRFSKEITSDPESFVQCADTIVRAVGDIGRMVDEFSAFARMPQPQIKPADLGRVVREAMVLPRQSRADIAYTISLPDPAPVVACDARLIGQALSNILLNAADAVTMRSDAQLAAGEEVTPKRVHVSLLHEQGEWQIVTTDNGIGLPQDDRSRLFEPYVTHKPKGTGLGLAIVKKILEDHGGRLVLEDNPDGVGAMVILCLPALEKTAGPATQQRETLDGV